MEAVPPRKAGIAAPPTWPYAWCMVRGCHQACTDPSFLADSVAQVLARWERTAPSSSSVGLTDYPQVDKLFFCEKLST